MSFVIQLRTIASLNVDLTVFKHCKFFDKDTENFTPRSTIVRICSETGLCHQVTTRVMPALQLHYTFCLLLRAGKTYILSQPSVPHLYRRSCYAGNNDNV